MPDAPEQLAARQTKGFWSGELGYAQAVVAIIGAIAAGGLLQWVRGGGAITPPAWPINACLLGGFILWIAILSFSENRVTAWLAGAPFALVSILAVGFFGTVGGIVPQTPDAPAWAIKIGWNAVFRSPAFVVALLLLLTNIGMATVRKARSSGLRGWLFSLNHLGIWIALAGAMFGAGDVVRARMMLIEGNADARIVDERGRHGFLPFGLFLQRFYIELYPSENGRPGAVRSYTAEVTVLGPGKKTEDAKIVVNQPLRREGWALYLMSYELSPAGESDRCVIEAVRDPWLPAVYSGISLMLGGACAMLFKSPFQSPPDPEGSLRGKQKIEGGAR